MIAQIVVFFAQRKKNLRFVPQKLRKSFANGNPMRKIVVFNSDNYLYIVSDTEIASHFRNAKFTLES